MKMDNNLISICIPTYKRDSKIIERVLRSIIYQSPNLLDRIRVVIISDVNGKEPHVEKLVEKYKNVINIIYKSSNKHLGDYANTNRSILLEYAHNYLHTKYNLFLDDDNLIFPHYLETCIDKLESNPEIDFTICKIIHLGPLPPHFGKIDILTGVPPVKQNIDTLQVFCKTSKMYECGWDVDAGYIADGVTFEKLANMAEWIEIDEILGVHL